MEAQRCCLTWLKCIYGVKTLGRQYLLKDMVVILGGKRVRYNQSPTSLYQYGIASFKREALHYLGSTLL